MIIFTGSDQIVIVTLKDNSGNIIPPSTTSDIIITAYQTKENIVQQWKASDGKVTTVNDSQGTVAVNLDRDNTINLPPKRLFLEVIIELSNPDFEGGIQRLSNTGGGIVLCDLETTIA